MAHGIKRMIKNRVLVLINHIFCMQLISLILTVPQAHRLRVLMHHVSRKKEYPQIMQIKSKRPTRYLFQRPSK